MNRHLALLFLALALSGCASNAPKVYTIREASKSEIAEAKKSEKKRSTSTVMRVAGKNKKVVQSIVQVIDLGPTFQDGKILPGGRYYRIVEEQKSVLKTGVLPEDKIKKSASDSKNEKRVTKSGYSPSQAGDQAAKLSLGNSTAEPQPLSDPFMEAFSPIPPKAEEQATPKQFDDPRTALEQYKSGK